MTEVSLSQAEYSGTGFLLARFQANLHNLYQHWKYPSRTRLWQEEVLSLLVTVLYYQLARDAFSNGKSTQKNCNARELAAS